VFEERKAKKMTDNDNGDRITRLSPEETTYENVSMQAEVLIWLFRLIRRNPDAWSDPELLAMLGILGDDTRRLSERELLDTDIDRAGKQAMKDMNHIVRSVSRSIVVGNPPEVAQALEQAESALTERHDRFLGRL
jgi:hypothetical protein